MNTLEALTADTANQKQRGGYYTPPAIACFLARWAVRQAGEEVLEPSCGDGGLLLAAANRLMELGATPLAVSSQLHAIELYHSEAAQSQARLAESGIPSEDVITVGDFFAFDDQEWGIIGRKTDVVIGNPPFLRYHSFPEEQRQRAFRIMQTAGLHPSRLTNSWVPFLIAASLRLRETGRLAMIIPAELLQVKYAEETRAFLARHFGAITVVTFRRLVFEGIQQEVVLLLAEKTPEIMRGIDIVELEDASELEGFAATMQDRRHFKTIDQPNEKWTQYYLDSEEISLLRKLKQDTRLTRLGQLGCVDVGVVTGNNDFFVLSEEQVQQEQLMEWTLPLVGRTAQLPGLTLGKIEWLANRDGGSGCHLLNLPATPFEALPAQAQAYVRSGEEAEAHVGFKCRNRKLWYITPSLWSPDAFLFRQIHAYPKIVVNGAGATSTDTIHRVRLNQPQHGSLIAATFLNALTFAFAEVMGRSYGGGVLELEPNEAELLPVPFFADAVLDFDALDRLERTGNVEAILDITDNVLLRGKLGLSEADIRSLRVIWRKLSGRRIGRKTKTARK